MAVKIHDFKKFLSFTMPGACRGPLCLISRINLPKKYSTKVDKKERRKQLISEFKTGSYFAHAREFQKTGGKRFHAPNELLRKEDSGIFPNFKGNSLAGNFVSLEEEFKDYVTLLLITMRGTAQPMCDVYREEFYSKFKETKKAKCIEVNVVDSWFYGLFRFFIARSLRKQVPKERHNNFMCYYGPIQTLMRQNLIGNMVVGYAYIIDREGYVRWKACAKPDDDELKSMVEATKLLMP